MCEAASYAAAALIIGAWIFLTIICLRGPRGR